MHRHKYETIRVGPYPCKEMIGRDGVRWHYESRCSCGALEPDIIEKDMAQRTKWHAIVGVLGWFGGLLLLHSLLSI